ncbi:hypothetical protein XELAEV_18002876mg [Xenopus laevis]|nr:hypothetical protein XELAEV_18002876mg [Xenopus laevis]
MFLQNLSRTSRCLPSCNPYPEEQRLSQLRTFFCLVCACNGQGTRYNAHDTSKTSDSHKASICSEGVQHEMSRQHSVSRASLQLSPDLLVARAASAHDHPQCTKCATAAQHGQCVCYLKSYGLSRKDQT